MRKNLKPKKKGKTSQEEKTKRVELIKEETKNNQTK
jgi:hypothetical protein